MKITSFLIIVTLLLASCSKDRITADGNVISEIRNPAPFKKIHTSGSNDISITYGNEYKVELRGSANLISRYKTTVRSNTLDLGYEHVKVGRDDIRIFVTLPSLSGISLSGSGNINIYGNFPDTELFNLRVSGSAKTVVHDTFNADEVVANISGSGNADLKKISGKQSHVTISGSGDVWVSTLQHLKVNISGSGKVFYTGNPTVDADISGSGKVLKF